jgi:hypothetical protein
MDNTENQKIAVDAIHRISQEANMMVFMLVDEDLEMHIDEHNGFTQDEKDAIWERMHDAILDHYYEMLDMVIRDVVSERDS